MDAHKFLPPLQIKLVKKFKKVPVNINGNITYIYIRTDQYKQSHDLSLKDLPVSYYKYAGFKGKRDAYQFIADFNLSLDNSIRNRQQRSYQFIDMLKLEKKEQEKALILKSDNINVPTLKISIDQKPLIYQNFGTINNKIVINNNKYLFTTILDEIDAFNGIIKVKETLKFSDNDSEIIRHKIYDYNGYVSDINIFVTDRLINYWNGILHIGNNHLFEEYSSPPTIEIFTKENLSLNISSKKLNYDNYTLRRDNPLILDPRFKFIDYPINKKDNCFYDYCEYMYGISFLKKPWLKLKNIYESFKELTKIIKVGLRSFDINCNIIDDIPCTSGNKILNKNNKVMLMLIHSNHIYCLSQEPTLNKNLDLEIEITDNIDDKLIKYLDNGVEPFNIKLQQGSLIHPSILSFEIENKIITSNIDYYTCLDILKKFDLEDRMNININKDNIINIIASKYEKKFNVSTKSCFPRSSRFNKGGYTYLNNDLLDIKDKYTVDKNKAYCSIMSQLPFLIITDYKVDKIYEVNSDIDIIDHYLYLIVPEYSTLLLPEENLYSGIFLKYCKEQGLNFKIKEYIETTYVKNIYKELFDDVLKLFDSNDDNFKIITNAMRFYIGKMAADNTFNSTENCEYIYNRISNKEELECNGKDLYIKEIKDNCYISYERKIYNSNIMNRKPISIQIIDDCRKNMYDYLHKNNINDKDIVQIKTDSITVINKKLPFTSRNDFYGYKEEKFSPLKSNRIHYNKNLTLKLNDKFNNNNKLTLAFAGAGKTRDIVLNIIPEIEKRNESYCILAPTHKALCEFRKIGKNCDIICGWSDSDKLNNYKNLIIDEVGMITFDSWNKIINLSLQGTNIYAYGDFTQLPPVGRETINNNQLFGIFSPTFMEWFFSEVTNPYERDNLRNDFTWEYYDDLKNCKLNLINEVKKYNTIVDPEYYISWRKSTRDLYNNKILKSMGFDHHLNIGVRIIADLVDHRDQRKEENNLRFQGIYNSCIYVIKEIGLEYSTIQTYDEYEINIRIKNKDILKYFIPAYAINIYKLQGQSIKSYYWCDEDDIFLTKENSGTISYVIISRLKTK